MVSSVSHRYGACVNRYLPVEKLLMLSLWFLLIFNNIYVSDNGVVDEISGCNSICCITRISSQGMYNKFNRYREKYFLGKICENWIHLQGMALTKVPKIKFLIIIGGAKLKNPLLAEKAFDSPIQCPSLHFLGIFFFFKNSTSGFAFIGWYFLTSGPIVFRGKKSINMNLVWLTYVKFCIELHCWVK